MQYGWFLCTLLFFSSFDGKPVTFWNFFESPSFVVYPKCFFFYVGQFPDGPHFFCTSSFHFSSIPRSPSMASFLPCLSPPFDLFSPPSFTPVPFSAFVVPFFFLLFGPLNYLQVLSCDYVHLFFDSSPYFIILLDLIFFVAGYSPLFLLFFTL